MNPLNNSVMGSTLSPQLTQNIQQVKSVMKMLQSGNPTQILQQNPMINQVMQQFKGQNLQDVFMSMCKSKGIDPNAILNELQK